MPIHACVHVRPRRPLRRLAAVLLVALGGSGGMPARAQTRESEGTVTALRLVDAAVSAPAAAATPLSLEDAIARGLEYNLGARLGHAGAEAAEGRRDLALSALLPHVAAQGSAVRQKINLAAFGFSAPGIPPIVGPFNVFDGRVEVSQALVDLSAFEEVRRQGQSLSAALDDERDARRVVALVVTNLYLQAVASASRIEAGRAQLETSRTLHRLALDLKAAGLVAGIDVLRAEVQLESTEQRQITLENGFERDKLALARAIGHPVGEAFTLTDALQYRASAPSTGDATVQRAYDERADLKAAEARVKAAEAARRAARNEHLPSLRVRADYGAIGNTVDTARPTFAVAAAVRVPIFDGLTSKGRELQAQGEWDRATAERDDLRNRIAFEVRTALLDLDAADRRVSVTTHTVQLATQQQQQALDRFKAGVASNLEIVQAQEALASANDTYISSVFAHNMAKAALARAVGVPEGAFRQAVTGDRP